jgi:hypothetical protein
LPEHDGLNPLKLLYRLARPPHANRSARKSASEAYFPPHSGTSTPHRKLREGANGNYGDLVTSAMRCTPAPFWALSPRRRGELPVGEPGLNALETFLCLPIEDSIATSGNIEPVNRFSRQLHSDLSDEPMSV